MQRLTAFKYLKDNVQFYETETYTKIIYLLRDMNVLDIYELIKIEEFIKHKSLVPLHNYLSWKIDMIF